MAGTLDAIVEEIQSIQAARAAARAVSERPRWPMIVLRTPKGWTGPKEVDGKKTEGFWRSHQVPMGEMHENPAHVQAPRGLDEELSARGALRRRAGGSSQSWPSWPPRARGGWAPIRTRTAACSSRI